MKNIKNLSKNHENLWKWSSIREIKIYWKLGLLLYFILECKNTRSPKKAHLTLKNFQTVLWNWKILKVCEKVKRTWNKRWNVGITATIFRSRLSILLYWKIYGKHRPQWSTLTSIKNHWIGLKQLENI